MEPENDIYIGFADMEQDGSLRIELRLTPDGLRHRTIFFVKPGEPDYECYITALGGDLRPGDRRSIKPHQL